jgi:hypothetical protein
MKRPSPRQWLVLWLGAICVVFTLAVAEEYVLRGVFAALLVTGLLFWQLAPRTADRHPSAPMAPIEHGLNGTDFPPDDVDRKEASVTGRPGPVGVAGWLGVFVLGPAIFVPLWMLNLVAPITGVVSTGAFLGLLFGATAVFAASAYLTAALFGGWPNAPRMALWYVSVSSVVGILLMVGSSNANRAANSLGELVGTLGSGAVWSAYLLKSRRVRNTYLADPERPVRRTRARVVVMALTALLLASGVIAHVRTKQRIDQQYAELTPYRWISAAWRLDPSFPEAFAKGVVERVQGELPKSTVSLVAPATLDDINLAARTSVRYTAEFDTGAGGTGRLEGEAWSYFHDDGIVTIESACIPALVECARMRQLISAAEGALLPKLRGSQLNGILPAGQCTAEPATLPNQAHPSDSITCSYNGDGAASLSMTRISLMDAQTQLRSGPDVTPEFKVAIVRRALAPR